MSDHAIKYSEHAAEEILGLPQDLRACLLEKILVTSYRWKAHHLDVTLCEEPRQEQNDYNICVLDERGACVFFLLAHYSTGAYSFHS
ncbi:MAG: hypothetical protein KAJ73_00120 [Zetaproteobacteria bacterium]|nr:hypothetical protein [Zetaproteobacteria bacterium]